MFEAVFAEHPGRIPTPGSLMLDSSFPHLSTSYQSVTLPSQNSSQSETIIPVTSPVSISMSGAEKGKKDLVVLH